MSYALAASASLTLLLAGCGGHTSAPTQVQTQVTPFEPTWSLSGRVTSQTGTAVAGAAVTSVQSRPTTSDENGNFTMAGLASPGNPYTVTVNASNYLTRAVWVQWLESRPGITLDLISTLPPFNASSYTELTRNTYDMPGSPDGRPLRIWALGNPKIYLRTVYETGEPVEPGILDGIEATIPRAVRDWTVGKRQVDLFERGTAVRSPEDGWIMVSVLRREPSDAHLCGTAWVGVPAGEIHLVPGPCTCGSDLLPAGVIAHEVGHAMGFYHVSDPGALMYHSRATCGESVPTERERFHATVAWSRQAGNEYPDTDPEGATPLARRGILVRN